MCCDGLMKHCNQRCQLNHVVRARLLCLQFNTYWQLYSNVRLANGTGDRGYHMLDANNFEMPIWIGMRNYFLASQEFLQRFWMCYGGWPSDYTYR